jgi:hypothetical protein
MPATYEPIATTTLGSAAASITLSSIPSTFTDLKLIFVGSNVDTPWMEMQLNNNTTDLYSDTEFYGTGAAVSNARQTGATSMRIAYPLNSATIPSMVELDFFSYTGSTFKTVLSRGSNDLNGSGNVWRSVGLFRSTSAITSIKLIAPGGNNFYAGATVSLYGIKNA